MVKSIGIIGMSEGNGHPFSYSSIINGYSPEGLGGIRMDREFTNMSGVATHPSSESANGRSLMRGARSLNPQRRLCAACRIPNNVSDYREFLGNVNAVIIARDDYQTHFEMAKVFLEAGLPVFVDKPLEPGHVPSSASTSHISKQDS